MNFFTLVYPVMRVTEIGTLVSPYLRRTPVTSPCKLGEEGNENAIKISPSFQPYHANAISFIMSLLRDNREP